LKKSGIFSNFEFLKQPHYWTILKNAWKILICDFLSKNREGQKKAKFTFLKKSRFFAKMVFCDFYCGGLMPKWKNMAEKCPVRNIKFLWNTKNCCFFAKQAGR
jgi:hypothetical protein